MEEELKKKLDEELRSFDGDITKLRERQKIVDGNKQLQDEKSDDPSNQYDEIVELRRKMSEANPESAFEEAEIEAQIQEHDATAVRSLESLRVAQRAIKVEEDAITAKVEGIRGVLLKKYEERQAALKAQIAELRTGSKIEEQRRASMEKINTLPEQSFEISKEDTIARVNAHYDEMRQEQLADLQQNMEIYKKEDTENLQMLAILRERKKFKDYVMNTYEPRKFEQAKEEQPEVREGEPTQPEAGEGEPTQPEAGEGEPTQPEAGKGTATQPETEKGTATKHEAGKGTATKTEAGKGTATKVEGEKDKEAESTVQIKNIVIGTKGIEITFKDDSLPITMDFKEMKKFFHEHKKEIDVLAGKVFSDDLDLPEESWEEFISDAGGSYVQLAIAYAKLNKEKIDVQQAEGLYANYIKAQRVAEGILGEDEKITPEEVSELSETITYDRRGLDYLKPTNMFKLITRHKEYRAMRECADIAEMNGVAKIIPDRPGRIKRFFLDIKELTSPSLDEEPEQDETKSETHEQPEGQPEQAEAENGTQEQQAEPKSWEVTPEVVDETVRIGRQFAEREENGGQEQVNNGQTQETDESEIYDEE
jgi:hypothetical protein